MRKKKILVSLVVLALATTVMSCGVAELSQEEKNKALLWEAAKEEISEKLKFPDTAEFPDVSEALVEEKDGKYKIIGTVNAQTGIGAMVPTAFEMYATIKDGECIPGDSTLLNNGFYTVMKECTEEEQKRKEEGNEILSASSLDEELENQDVIVLRVNVEQQKDLFAAAGDFMGVCFRNNSDKTIKDINVAVVGFDSKGEQIRIKSAYDSLGSSYLLFLTYADINLKPGKSTFGDSGQYVDTSSAVKSGKAIVMSYTTTDGEKWENPYVADFVKNYNPF